MERMITKHFFKILIAFTGMIALGLIGVFLVSYFDKGDVQNAGADKNPVETSACKTNHLC